MVDNSHSKSVRGTLSNPKTQEAKNSSKPVPRLGDGTSLKPANDDKPLPSNDSAPPAGQGNDTPSKSKDSSSSSSSTSDSAPTVSDPYRKSGTDAGGPDKKAIGNGRDDAKAGKGAAEQGEGLPHSKKVRGTLANDDGKKVNRTQLGDPASLKSETSKTNDMGKGTEREGQDKSAKSKL
jgi:hypothetical protein